MATRKLLDEDVIAISLGVFVGSTPTRQDQGKKHILKQSLDLEEPSTGLFLYNGRKA